MQQSVICLWFDGNAQQAVEYYMQVFKDGKIHSEFYTDVAPPRQGNKVPLTIEFEMGGIRYMALNGGPHYNFTPATSIMVNCDSQQEIDYYWEQLSKGGTEVQCGWLTDQFGLSWQIAPAEFSKWLHSEEPGKADRVMKAMMTMVKLDLEAMKNA